eukprot:988626-Rhodomonas_salina.2
MWSSEYRYGRWAVQRWALGTDGADVADTAVQSSSAGTEIADSQPVTDGTGMPEGTEMARQGVKKVLIASTEMADSGYRDGGQREQKWLTKGTERADKGYGNGGAGE